MPKQLQKAGVSKTSLSISDSALRLVIEGYAREAGVRQLEKQLGKLVRKAVVKLMEDPEAKLKIGTKDLEAALGIPVFRSEQVLAGKGVITGLAWTSMGGATLPIEATRIHTLNRGFKLTGKLGDVMKESAEIAYSYVSSNLKQFGGDPASSTKRSSTCTFLKAPRPRTARVPASPWQVPVVPRPRPGTEKRRSHDGRAHPHRPGAADWRGTRKGDCGAAAEDLRTDPARA